MNDDSKRDLLTLGVAWERDGKGIDPNSVYLRAQPVAWAITDHGNVIYLNDAREDSEREFRKYGSRSGMALLPLYTAPPAPVHQPVHGWTDADADAARLALELECLLTDGDMPTASVSRWWESAHEALRLHRERLATTPAAPGHRTWDMERIELLRKIKSKGVQR